MAGLFFYDDVIGAKKDGLISPSKVPANAQGECGEDQEAGALRTPYRNQRFPAFLSRFYSSLLRNAGRNITDMVALFFRIVELG
jgi:hypothetical protein